MIRNYITLKSNNKYYRLLKIDEGSDDSIYIWRNLGGKWYGKFSYHHGHITGNGSNFGYQRHQKVNGKIIPESIRYASSKLQNQRQVFYVHHINNSLPSGTEIRQDELSNMDLVFEIDKPINGYEILMSVNRDDLMIDTEFIHTQKCNVQSGNFFITFYKK